MVLRYSYFVYIFTYCVHICFDFAAATVAFNHLEKRVGEILGTPKKRPPQVKGCRLKTVSGALLVRSQVAGIGKEQNGKRKRNALLEANKRQKNTKK